MNKTETIDISNTLYEEARVTGSLNGKPVSAQVEHWAALGRAVDQCTSKDRGELAAKGIQPRSVSPLLDSVDTPEGRERHSKYLESLPYPHFEAHPTERGLLVMVDQDGTRTIGRFEGREFKRISNLPTGGVQHAKDGSQINSAENSIGHFDRVLLKAVSVFGDEATARRWMVQSLLRFQNKTSVEMLRTEEDARCLEQILVQTARRECSSRAIRVPPYCRYPGHYVLMSDAYVQHTFVLRVLKGPTSGRSY